VYGRGSARDPEDPTGPVVIDLGVLAPAGNEAVLEFGPGTSQSRPRPSPWLVVLLVLACCWVGVTSAVEPAAPARLVLAASGVVDPPQFTGDAVLASIGGEITSYDLESGAVRWQYDPPRRTQTFVTDDTVVVAPVSCSARTPFQTYALDAGTGAPRWDRRGAPVWLVDGAPIVVMKQPVRGCSEATLGFDPLPSAPFTWLGVDLNTGDVRWELKIPAAVGLAAGVDPAGVARWLAIFDAGTVTTYDLRTGAVAGRYEPKVSDPYAPKYRVLGAGDQLLLARRDRSTVELSAFDALSLRPRWSSSVVLPSGIRQDMGGVFANRCGPVICLGPGTQTVGLDPRTGRERWRLPGRPSRIGPGYALFVRTPRPSELPPLVVHDLASGAERATLRDTSLVSRDWSDPLLNRPGPEGRLWRLDLADGRLRAVTVLPGQFADCDAHGRYLACRSSDGELRVWKLPAAGEAPFGATPARRVGERQVGTGGRGGGRSWPTF
jgi:outer membrane protein assembly factor BamB